MLEGVLAALAHAEHFGVAHRDLKPENVLVTRRGAVKIADFGIAKAYTTSTRGFTETGTAVGTPAYMAPEQALGQRVGPYTDLYAVGVMAYEMLSGAPPFAGTDTPMAVMFRHVNEVPPRLEGVDARLADWVARLLEKEPKARFPGAAEAWQELEDIVVDLLGPYWRRNSMLDGPEAAAAAAAATPAAAPPEPATAPGADASDEPADWQTYESPPPRSAADPAEFVTTDPSSWTAPAADAGAAASAPEPPAAPPAEDRDAMAGAAQRPAAPPDEDRGAAPPPGVRGAMAGAAPDAGAAAADQEAGEQPPGDRGAVLPPLPPRVARRAAPPAEEPPSSAATVPPAARRGGADGPVERTLVSRVADAPPGVRTEHRTAQRRRRALAAGAAVLLLGGGVAAALALNPDAPPATPTPTATATVTATATPFPDPARGFDFDGDGNPAVVAGLPRWQAAGAGGGAAGAVALPGTSQLLAGAELDPPVEGAFGAAVASADFDRDGHADMAIGSPRADTDDAEGRAGAVTILPGSARGLVPDRAATRPGPGVSGAVPRRALRRRARRRRPRPRQVLRPRDRRSRRALPGRAPRVRRAAGDLRRTRRPPGGPRAHDPPARAGDGRLRTLLRTGDANRDGNVDVIEASPGDPANGIPGTPTTARAAATARSAASRWPASSMPGRRRWPSAT